MIAFILTIPNVNSWNNRWSGEGEFYCIIKAEKAVPNFREIIDNNFYYNFGDGWAANVEVKRVNNNEAIKMKNRSKGFCGYNWMVSSIINHGEIRKPSSKSF